MLVAESVSVPQLLPSPQQQDSILSPLLDDEELSTDTLNSNDSAGSGSLRGVHCSSSTSSTPSVSSRGSPSESTVSSSKSTVSPLNCVKLEQNGNEFFPNLDVATLISLNSGIDSDSENDEIEESTVSRRNKDSESSESENDDDNRSSSAESTSCSENSFEMSSATSFASTLNKADQVQQDQAPFQGQGGVNGFKNSDSQEQSLSTSVHQKPPNFLKVHTGRPAAAVPVRPSYSMDSFLVSKPLSPEAREQISQQLSELDTGLPELDFERLEQKLSTAAKEHEESERRKLGDEVRRRLALQYDQFTTGPSPSVNTRPLKSNLAHRLTASKNLQVCYMNELAEDDEDSDDDFSFAPCTSSQGVQVPKSKSTPNLNSRRGLNASELMRRRQPEVVGFHDRLTILREETQLMLEQAKKAAKLQMEVEKQKEELTDKHVNKRLSRLHLSRMEPGQLRTVLDEINYKIDVANAELVTLLVEKDGLYMEQDSMLVDIEDTIQHTVNCENLGLPPFLYVDDSKDHPASAPPTTRPTQQKQQQQPQVPQSASRTSLSSLSSGIFSPTRWKIFKR